MNSIRKQLYDATQTKENIQKDSFFGHSLPPHASSWSFSMSAVNATPTHNMACPSHQPSPPQSQSSLENLPVTGSGAIFTDSKVCPAQIPPSDTRTSKVRPSLVLTGSAYPDGRPHGSTTRTRTAAHSVHAGGQHRHQRHWGRQTFQLQDCRRQPRLLNVQNQPHPIHG